ncbi:MAG: amidohydrolase family protein [Actinomycetota bacterium]|nr:amidohydrolase family protein [Actinomycetota bacterium]
MLRTPGGEPLVRDVVHGRWARPEGAADSTLGEGLWALPGLVDGHAHFAAVERADWVTDDVTGAGIRAGEALTAGVMLALDKGWSDLTAIEMLGRIGLEDRPDIEAAGVIISVDGGYWPDFGREAAPGEMARAVAGAVAESKGWVKLIGDWPRRGIGPVPNFTEAELGEAVRVANGLGARVAIHTMAREVPSMAVRAGIHSIEHGLFLTEEDIVDLGARGGMWVPTVLRMEAVIRQLGAESTGGRLLREGIDNVARMLDTAVEAGVFVLAGTDLAVGTRAVAAEAIRLWELGMSPARVVGAVSNAGFKATGRADAFEVDTPANVVLYSEDPRADPRVLAHPLHVVRLGRLLG